MEEKNKKNGSTFLFFPTSYRSNYVELTAKVKLDEPTLIDADLVKKLFSEVKKVLKGALNSNKIELSFI